MPIVGLALAVVALALPARAAIAAPSDSGSWHVAATLALGTESTAISCADATTCWSLEAGQLLSSTDGGDTWTSRNALVPDDVAALDAIACPAPSTCYLTATTVGASTEVLVVRGGALRATTVADANPWSAIACPGVRHCLATDGVDVFTTRDGGRTWVRHALPQPLTGSPGLSCVVGTIRCWAVGDRGESPIIERTTNDGETWTFQTAPGNTDGLYAVACPSPTTCFAGGATFSDAALVIVTTDAGRHWILASLPFHAYAIRSLACASTNACWAVGQGPGATPFVVATADGTDWNPQTLPVGPTAHPVAVACPTKSRCAAVAGGIAFVTADAGTTWSGAPVPAAIEAPQSLSCPSATTCVGVENDAVGRPQSLTTNDGGTSWTAHDLPVGTGRLLAVDCASIADCVALAMVEDPETGRRVAHASWTHDGGATWAAGRIVSAGGVLGKVACPSVTTCLAIGYDSHSAPKLDVTTDSGRTWRAVAAPSSVFYLDAIGCDGPSACALIAHAPNAAPMVFTTADLGTTYESHAVPYADATDIDFTDLGCAGATCVAVGENLGEGVIMRSVDDGATWKAAKVPRAVQTMGSVSCATTTACAATALDYSERGGPLVVTSTDSGRTWSTAAVPARDEQPIDIACAATGCIASDVSVAGNPLVLAGSF